jgi:hypothetical protein
MSAGVVGVDAVGVDAASAGVPAENVLDAVLDTFENWVAPELSDPFVRSLAITTRALVRHVRARVVFEGPTLWDDNADLRQLLGQLAELLPPLSRQLGLALDASRLEPGAYPSVARLREEADRLRRALSDVIDRLWSQPDQAAHDLVRRYLSRQLMREAAWTTEVFVGARR